MADPVSKSPHTGSASPPPNCAICLGNCTDKCFSNSCMHQFCFKCLLEWSKIKAECPLCKQSFKSIIHNIKSNEEYDEYFVESNILVDENRYIETPRFYLPNATSPMHHQYHFRTTFTVDTHGEHAIQQMLLSHPLLSFSAFTYDRYANRRRGTDTSTTFRRSIYNQNLWVYAPPDITGRYRDVSPLFFRNNPAARTRLVPWLNRELNALLYENTQHVMRLVDIIMDHLLRHHICSHVFRTLLSGYLRGKTDHFVHEFYNFMRSPFDMVGYDRHVIYTERSTFHTPYIDISDYDSDVILVSATNGSGNGATEIIDLVDTDSDEPIIVSEDQYGSRPNDDQSRRPILPPKLRLKSRHKSKVRRQKRTKYLHRSSSSSSLSSDTTSSSSSDSSNTSSTTSTTSTSSSKESVSTNVNHVANKRRRKRRRSSSTSNNAIIEVQAVEDTSDDDVPLSKLARKKRRLPKGKKRFRKLKKENAINVDHSFDESKENLVSYRLRPPELSPKPSPFLTDIEEDVYEKPKLTKNIKSDIRDVKVEEKPGPSCGRLRNIFRKEETSNLWYSRPCVYESDDSSDN